MYEPSGFWAHIVAFLLPQCLPIQHGQTAIGAWVQSATSGSVNLVLANNTEHVNPEHICISEKMLRTQVLRMRAIPTILLILSKHNDPMSVEPITVKY